MEDKHMNFKKIFIGAYVAIVISLMSCSEIVTANIILKNMTNTQTTITLIIKKIQALGFKEEKIKNRRNDDDSFYFYDAKIRYSIIISTNADNEAEIKISFNQIGENFSEINVKMYKNIVLALS